ASKKAANRRQRGAQKACSNVFSMFEQSQIQEFKEVEETSRTSMAMAFGCIDQDRDGVIKKQDLKETYGQLGAEKLNVKDEELDENVERGEGYRSRGHILAAFKLFDSNATGSINKD
ncbi:hypothetical protein CRUP_036360, partial [Coryphaenoides rupestris]